MYLLTKPIARFRISLVAITLAVAVPSVSAQSHPGIFISGREGAAIRASLGKYPVLNRTMAEARAMMDTALSQPMDVPQPGEAGGDAHERHKQNYREMATERLVFLMCG